MLFKSFFANRRGNTAVVFGLAAFGLVAAVGGSIDLGRMITARSSLQDAADAAVLRAATMSSGTTDAAQKTAAHLAFNGNLATDLKDKITSKDLLRVVEGSNTSLTYTATAKLPTLLLQIVGIQYFDLSVESEAKAQMRKSEIVFVLDSTGSMSKDGRMTNLKSSVDTVLASLLDSTGKNSTGTKVGVVPFDTQVRVSPGVGYAWVDYGTASSSQSCTGLSGSYCTMMIDAVERACMTSADPLSCKSTAKLYTKTYKGTGSNSGNTYYEVYVKVYDAGSNTSRTYTEKSYTYTQTYTTTGGTSCNAETGACSTTTGGQSATRTVTVFDSQSGTSTAGKSGYDSTNNVPSGFGSVASTVLTYSYGYSNGYDGKDAYTVKSTTNGLAKTTYFPAIPSNRSAWTGCVIDRTQPYDVSAESPGAAAASKYPARPCANGNNLLTMRALSEDITATRTYIKGLTPSGNTNVTIGVQWGIEILSPSEPMTGGVAFKDDITYKYMILVTDGENTQNRWTSTTATIDARTKLACQAAKDKGITVFVIRVMEGNSDLLSQCASKTEYYYDLTNATQLNQALKDVFEAIKKTRLTK
ncbi:TadE/TadG family type IV pilus assembly protein [Asticcacaulis sp. AND118]|uniref:TadE/TadG family type IV pilus assembly protein n=1 Tax=Asticcacaulis sp. AND118 TaxID=2840468 RepID=UPI001D000C0E|nr:TadE/TadG family type IV pilus assembly protein [Asticcacaulis sp. AND118]UDF02683.1 pilus assembly protein [Asticcacaulis sp. AND118]